MTLKKRTTGSSVATFEQSRVNRSGSQSSPLLTPLALLLLGAVQMARAQAEQAQPAWSVADAPSDNPQGELFADADQPAQVPAGSAVVSEATPAELLALLQSLADSARESADALVQEAGEGAAQQTQAGEAASVAQATVDRLGQLDRAEAVLEAYQNVINQLPADLVLAQAPAAAAGAEAAATAGAASTAGAAAAAAGGVSAGTMLAGLLGLAAIGAAAGGGGGPSNAPPTGAVTISGTAAQGQTLAVTNTLADADGISGAVVYQWKADGTAIAGATGTSFALTQAQVGKVITVTASYTDSKGTAESVTSTATSAVANVNDPLGGSVSIAGTATQGQVLTASNNLTDADGIPSSGAGAVSYQWKADGTAIAGATNASLTLAQAQVGKAITVTATYTDSQGTTETATSTATAAVANVNDAPVGAVSISGTAAEAQTLTASNNLTDADGIPSSGAGAIAYQWSADGTAIAGATNSTFLLTALEVGKVVTVTATYTDSLGTAETVTSTATAPVTAEVTAHDGYIDGAKVYVDLNDNGVVDLATDKYLGQTVNGKLAAVLTDADKLHSLIAQGGTDISTGSAFGGSFSTTAGSTVINPLSTLVQALVQATASELSGLTAAEKEEALARAKADAMAAVSAALGIDADVDLTQLDTVEASSGGGEIVVGFDESDAIDLHSKALMVANLISMGTAAMAGAAAASGDTTTGIADFSKYVVQGIVNSVKTAASSGESVSFGSAESVKQMIDTAVDAAKTDGKALDTATVDNASSKVAGAVAVTNQLIGAFAADAANAVAAPGATSAAGTTGLTQMLQVQKAVLGQAGELKRGSNADLTNLNTLSDAQAVLDAAKNVTGLKIGNKDVGSVATVPTGDTTAPTVTSIDVRPARVGDMAQIVVKMSESVLIKPGTGGQFATLSITTSAAGASSVDTAIASLDPGLSNGNNLVFTYRVQAGDARVLVADGASISLAAGASIKDLAGNNAVATIASGRAVTVDSIAPTVAISSDAAFVKAGATATVTFTLSEAASTRTAGAFTAEDVTVKNGTLSGFAQDASNPLKYTAKLAATSASAPAEVGIAGGKFTDAVGNANLPSNVVLLAQEGAAPVVAVSSDQSFFNTINTSSGTASTVLRFSLSAASTDFTAADVTVAGPGTLSGFTGSGKEYSATLTGMTSETKVSVVKDAFSVSGTTAKNVASNALGFKVDTDKPTVSIEVLKGASGTEPVTSASTLKAGDTARVTFTLSEGVQGFGPQAVKVTGGFLENFAQDKADTKKFTAVFRPAPPEAGQTGAVDASISVDGKRFSDLAGNPNEAAQLASFKVDNIKPLVTGVTDDTAGTARSGAAVTYVYQFSKAVSGLAADDFTASNGSIVEVKPDPTSIGSGASTSVYTKWAVKAMPTDGVASGNIGLVLKAGAVTDAVGNANQEHRQNLQEIDTKAPAVVAMESTPKIYLTPSLNGGQVQTGQVKVSFSEPVTGLGVDDFELKFGDVVQSSAVRAATLTGLAGSGKDWTVNFTPPAPGGSSGGGETPTEVDTGAGFIEIKNLVLTNPTSSTTTVKFDITLDSATYQNNKITGLVVDLDYDTSKVVSGSVSSVTVDGVVGSDATYSPIVRNIAPAAGNTATVTGKIAAPVDTSAPSTAFVIDSSGKALTVTLGLNTAETSFRVALQSKASGGETIVTTSAGSFDVDVGIAKTAALASSNGGSGSIVGSDVNSVSLALVGGYTDLAGNAGAASNAPLKLLVNQVNPSLTLTLDKVTATGDLVYTVEASDPAVTGLGASDFSATNGTVVASSFAAVSGQAGKYTISVAPTATGDVKLKAAADAGTSAGLGTLAAESAAIKVVKGTAGGETLNLADGRVFLLEGGSDTIAISSSADSPTSAFDTLVGAAAGDKLDITALLNKAGTSSQYFSVVDNSFPGAPPAGWLKTINLGTASDLGTVGDNELRYIQKVQDNVATLTFAYDTDSRAGSSTISESVQLRAVAADATTLAAWAQSDYVILEKIAPTISVEMEGGKTSFSKNSTGSVIFTTNEPIEGLPATALSVVGGSVSAPVQSNSNPLVWTATFTPTSDAAVTAASIGVKAGGYADYQGNAGSASSALALKINAMTPTLSMGWVDATPDGTLTFEVESDQALTGLEMSDFSIPGQSILTFQKVSVGTALPEVYQGTVKPSASGAITLTLPAGAATGTQLATPAAVSDPATINLVKSAGNGQPIVVSGPSGQVTPGMIVLGSGDETVNVTGVGTAAANGEPNFMGIVVGANSGDKIDISTVLGGLGYKSLAVPDAPDLGAGFVEIKNLVLTNPTASTTTVKFDLTLDSALYQNNKVTGLVVDLDYDTSKVVSGSVSSVTVDGVVGSDPTYSPIVRNIAPVAGSTVTGKIAAPVDTSAPASAFVIDANGKALSVTLGLNTAETSFRVALQSKAAGGETVVTTSAGSFGVDVGIAKTARLAGTSAGPTANALELVVSKQTIAANADTPAFGTAPTDNQIKVLQVIESSSVNGQAAKYGTLLFQYDTNPAAGTTTLSPVVQAELISSDIAAFFESNYVKLI